MVGTLLGLVVAHRIGTPDLRGRPHTGHLALLSCLQVSLRRNQSITKSTYNINRLMETSITYCNFATAPMSLSMPLW